MSSSCLSSRLESFPQLPGQQINRSKAKKVSAQGKEQELRPPGWDLPPHPAPVLRLHLQVRAGLSPGGMASTPLQMASAVNKQDKQREREAQREETTYP